MKTFHPFRNLTLFMLLSLLAFTSCGGDSENEETTYSLYVSNLEFKNIAYEGKRIEFEIKSNANWSISGAEPWMHLSETSGNGDKTIVVTVDAYNDTEAEVRIATLTVKSPNVKDEKKITFQQNPKSLFEATLKVNFIKYNDIEVKGETIKNFKITSNVEWRIENIASWIHLSETTGKGDATITITVDACEEVGDYPRTGTFKVVSDRSDKTCTVTIEQQRIPPFNVLDQFDDELFLYKVKTALKIDKDDTDAFVSVEQAKTITYLSLSGITSFKGLEYLTGLNRLEINYANQTTIDLSPLTNLKRLYLYRNPFSSIDISMLTNLTHFEIDFNPNLSVIDLSKNKKLENVIIKIDEEDSSSKTIYVWWNGGLDNIPSQFFIFSVFADDMDKISVIAK